MYNWFLKLYHNNNTGLRVWFLIVFSYGTLALGLSPYLVSSRVSVIYAILSI